MFAVPPHNRNLARLAKCGRPKRSVRYFVKNEDGATAVEFAMVAVPFLTMMYGMINGGLYFYAVNCLDRGVEDAARYIRTGEAQKGTIAGQAGPLTAGGFLNLVCTHATTYLDCSKLQIRIQSSGPDWSAINAINCPTTGDLTAGAISSGDLTPIATKTGTQNAHVLITACYKWELGKYLPFVHYSAAFGDGSALLQSSVALEIEPYL